ncbi:H repeat-containing Rhs element protein [Escherichia coli]|nr:H repeat-containing Rhs element protein [Escherichia coli]
MELKKLMEHISVIPDYRQAWKVEHKLSDIAKWHLNRSQFGIRIDHDLASISDHSLASQSITIWHASDH